MGIRNDTLPGPFNFFVEKKKKHKCEESALVICSQSWVLSSAVEHGIADPAVAGSIPAVPFFCLKILILAAARMELATANKEPSPCGPIGQGV